MKMSLIAAKVSSADRRLQNNGAPRAKVVMGIEAETGNVKKMVVSQDDDGKVSRKHEGELEIKSARQKEFRKDANKDRKIKATTMEPDDDEAWGGGEWQDSRTRSRCTDRFGPQAQNATRKFVHKFVLRSKLL